MHSLRTAAACMVLLVLASTASARLYIAEQSQQDPVLIGTPETSSLRLPSLLGPVNWLYKELQQEQQALQNQLRGTQRAALQRTVATIVDNALASARQQGDVDPRLQRLGWERFAQAMKEATQEEAHRAARRADEGLIQGVWQSDASQQLGWQSFKEAMEEVAEASRQAALSSALQVEQLAVDLEQFDSEVDDDDVVMAGLSVFLEGLRPQAQSELDSDDQGDSAMSIEAISDVLVDPRSEQVLGQSQRADWAQQQQQQQQWRDDAEEAEEEQALQRLAHQGGLGQGVLVGDIVLAATEPAEHRSEASEAAVRSATQAGPTAQTTQEEDMQDEDEQQQVIDELHAIFVSTLDDSNDQEDEQRSHQQSTVARLRGSSVEWLLEGLEGASTRSWTGEELPADPAQSQAAEAVFDEAELELNEDTVFWHSLHDTLTTTTGSSGASSLFSGSSSSAEPTADLDLEGAQQQLPDYLTYLGASSFDDEGTPTPALMLLILTAAFVLGLFIRKRVYSSGPGRRFSLLPGMADRSNVMLLPLLQDNEAPRHLLPSHLQASYSAMPAAGKGSSPYCCIKEKGSTGLAQPQYSCEGGYSPPAMVDVLVCEPVLASELLAGRRLNSK